VIAPYRHNVPVDDLIGWILNIFLRIFYWLFATITSAIVNAVSRARMRRRLHPYEKFAQQHGLAYQPVADHAVRGQSGPPFDHPGYSAGFGALTGRIGTFSFQSFEYRYTIEGAEFQFERYVRVALIRLPAALPPIRLGPENRFGQLFPGLAPLDVDIENDTFNRAYRVSAPKDTMSRRFAVALLNPRGVQSLLRVEPFAWRIRGAEAVCWWPVCGPAETMARVDAIGGLIASVPPFLWSDFGGHDRWPDPRTQ
jgi:hypothetical protein